MGVIEVALKATDELPKMEPNIGVQVVLTVTCTRSPSCATLPPSGHETAMVTYAGLRPASAPARLIAVGMASVALPAPE